MHTHLTSEQLTNLKKDIFEYLCNNCAGSIQAKPRYELLNYLISKGWSLSDREMRRLVEEMTMEHFLIGSSEHGYYIIDSPADLLKARQYLDKKAEAIAIRKNVLQTAWDSHFQVIADKQLTMLRELS